MHDARVRSVSSSRRLLTGVLASVLLTLALIAVAPVAYSPICALYSPGDIEWYLFMCFIDPPPKDPST